MRPVALAVAALLVLTASTAAVPVDRAIVVADADSGDRLASYPVDEGSNVTLAYTHSVEKTPVRDVYAVNGTRLEMTEMRFRSYGWGLPAGEAVRSEDGWFVFDPDRATDELYVTPGDVAGHRLVVDGESHDLYGLTGGDSVRLTVERRTVLEAAIRQ